MNPSTPSGDPTPLVPPREPPVPVTVWHLPDRWHTGDEFSPALAGLLVALHTRPGDTVLALGHDPALAGAAGAQGCTYLAVDDPADLAGPSRSPVNGMGPGQLPGEVDVAAAVEDQRFVRA